MQAKKQKLELDMEKETPFQIRKGEHQGSILSPCLFNFYAEYIMRRRKDKLKLTLWGEIPITSDMQMTPPLWQKMKKN